MRLPKWLTQGLGKLAKGAYIGVPTGVLQVLADILAAFSSSVRANS
jgi:hypothetical protein